MRSHQPKHTVLVPIFGSDISDETLAAASSLVNRAGARLVLLHVTPGSESAAGSVVPRTSEGCEPRWHRLASAAAPGHTFAEAVVGDDPADAVLAEAVRFHSDVIVLGPPAPAEPADVWIERAIARLRRAAPRGLHVAERPTRPRRATRLALRFGRRAFHQRRSHVAQLPRRLATPAARHERRGGR